MRYQPVPDPGNLRDYLALLEAGVLIDLAGRPLRWEHCPDCGGERTSGRTCPWALACPTCKGQPGKPCQRRRPSGHVLSEVFQPTHKARWAAAEALDEQRERDGDDTVPARWPPKALASQPAPAATSGQLDLFTPDPWGDFVMGGMR